MQDRHNAKTLLSLLYAQFFEAMHVEWRNSTPSFCHLGYFFTYSIIFFQIFSFHVAGKLSQDTTIFRVWDTWYVISRREREYYYYFFRRVVSPPFQNDHVFGQILSCCLFKKIRPFLYINVIYKICQINLLLSSLAFLSLVKVAILVKL